MFEFGIFCVFFVAAAYWTVLWLMGRREDVLHGQFVQGDFQPGEPSQSVLSKSALSGSILPQPVMPTAPPKSVLPTSLPSKSVLSEPAAFKPELLQSLLTSIKRDLDQLARK